MSMYGKFTWKIENFSTIAKRELRSNVFEVGGYKWCVSTVAFVERSVAWLSEREKRRSRCARHFARSEARCSRARAFARSRVLTRRSRARERRYILVYPQGCDVSNHLSLFLCVADYDKLLPGTCVRACVSRIAYSCVRALTSLRVLVYDAQVGATSRNLPSPS